MTLSPQWLDELRARVTLSGVIGRTTRLIKAGHEFKACCPFHNEKSPSFTVNDQKGFYHCFGCGAHGDVIRWMTDQRGLSFMDAVKELAAEAGMEVPAPDPRAARVAEQRNSLHDVMAAAQAWFVERLAASEGEKARAYLATRGFNQRTIERFGFGFAPEGRQALKEALKQFPEELLIEAGLRIAVEDKEPYDRFRSRLMLPIEDARGRVIAFGGRILDARKSDAPKYLNSPDTPLFDKGRTLYNLHRAGPASRQSGRIVVVEGYMDTIALAAAGIEDAVAPLGTALTERQIELLWRLVETPVLCFDGDAAGQRAAMRAVTRALPLLRPAHSLKIVRLPAGLDPDDLIRRDGAKAMEAQLAQPEELLDVVWEFEFKQLPLNTPEEKAGLRTRLMEFSDKIADKEVSKLYRQALLDKYYRFIYPDRPFFGNRRSELQKTTEKLLYADQREALKRYVMGGSRQQLEKAVIAGLWKYPDVIFNVQAKLERFKSSDPDVSYVVDLMLDAASDLDPDEADTIWERLGKPPPPVVSYSNSMYPFLLKDRDNQVARLELADAVEILIDRPAVEAALREATERVEHDLSDGAYAEQQRLLKRKLDFDARLRQMASARGAAPVGAATQKMAE